MSPSVSSSPLALTVLALLHYKPLHPYGVQRLIKQWGKDRVVNVGQRASLYRTIDRLHSQGLIAVCETGREHAYPERTVYELTDAGRQAARQWMDQMLAEPKREYPQFPAALSHLLMISPREALEVLERRAEQITLSRKEIERDLADQADALPRVTALEAEYLLAVTRAEERWLRSIVDDLRSERLTWTEEEVRRLEGAG